MSPSDADRKPSPLDRTLGLFGDVRAGEGPIVLLMALNVFVVLFAYYVLKTVREPLILASGGAELKSYAAAFQALTLIGYVISFPSTSEPTLGTGKWAVGPTAVVLRQSGPTTVGVLWNQVWSVAGAENREDVSQMFLQPFVAYNTKSHWTFTLQSETTANWKAETDKWTVPIIREALVLRALPGQLRVRRRDLRGTLASGSYLEAPRGYNHPPAAEEVRRGSIAR